MNQDDIQETIEDIEEEKESELNQLVNWMEKLKPSSRNKLIQRKYQNLSTDNYIPTEESLTKYGIDIKSLSKIDKNCYISEDSNKNGQNIGEKWKDFVVEREYNNSQIPTHNNETSLTDKNDNFEIDNSIVCFEEIGNIIEEKYKIIYTDSMFLKHQECHSIIPFLLISSKEIHRVCLSDYEIKHIYKLYKSKTKSFKAEGIDYYRIGLINFYKGKYILAYNSIKSAIKNNNKDLNFKKWFCFVCIILLFCDNNKINFKNMKNLKIEYDIKLTDDNSDEDGFSFFPCCSNRKGAGNNTKISTQPMQTVNKNEYDYLVTQTVKDTSSDYNSNKKSINKQILANEVMEYISSITNKDATKNIQIEGWWIFLLISVFCSLHANQKLFKESSIPEPRYCIKKIKELDDYLSYIAYGDYKYIIKDEFEIDVLLKQLLSKYPSKIEAYLKYWQLLIKGKYKNHELANSISEIYWKNSSILKFDDAIYNLYILLTHALSTYLAGNHFYSITYFQKEYPNNFLFPSIYYLFGKYTSKSNSKTLKNISISSLNEVFRLLYEDLKYSTLYWIGNIYFNTGNYIKCYKVWKKYLENADKSFDSTSKKIDRIKMFLKKYEILWNSVTELRKNIKTIKATIHTRGNGSKNNFVPNSTTNSYIKINNFNYNLFPSTNLNNYLKNIQSIKDLEVNSKFNRSIIHEYHTALCYLYIDKNIIETMKILMNIINLKRHYMPALFTMWKVLVYLKEYKLLLNFSLFMIKISHSNEVNFSDWVKSYILFSKALRLNNRNDEAVLLLVNILDIYAPIPLEEAKYLNTVYNQNKISTTNFFMNFDKALKFYSKYHIYKKCLGFFNIIQTKKQPNLEMNKNQIEDNGHFNINNTDDNINNSNNIITTGCALNTNKTYTSENFDEINLKDKFEGDSIIILEEFLESEIDCLEIPTESPFITVISNPDIFLEIGKICARSEIKRELGLMCLEDYIHLIKFIYNYKLNKKGNNKKHKAYFWMSILHIQLKQYNQAKECLDKIDNLYEIDSNRMKSKIIKLFLQFYKQHCNLDESISFDFEISKEDLNEI